MAESKYLTAPVASSKLPKGIPYIVSNEAAERFSFYGMKGILTIFMVDYLHLMGNTYQETGMSNAEATENYHIFTALVYFTPIAGALLSDILLGKYLTILSLSFVYCLGHLALALLGMPPFSPALWLWIGLGLISIGSGGIKPCVSAHVGDQFGQSNQHLMSKVFQWFYFSINLGSFVSTLLTPWLLEHYGPHLAFGVPGILMALATLLFWMGRKVFVHIPPGGTRFIQETFSWEGISALLKLGVLFAFVAVFWALFDQTGSSWVLQAKNLDREWLGFTWLESQIQAINPILVLVLIPLFQLVIYPALNRVVTMTPIRKIGLGLFVMAGGFAIVAVLQEMVDAGSRPSIAWQFLAYAVLTASEVMVSITCLEFAYTQSPKNMKSLVMALYLLSVSLGNVFTAVVNNRIQTPAVTDCAAEVSVEELSSGDLIEADPWLGRFELEGETRLIRVAGLDGEFDTDDDIRLVLNEDGKVAEVSTNSDEVFADAAGRIEAAFFSSPGSDIDKNLPDDQAGQELIADLTDQFGNPLQYKLISRDSYQVTSFGADKDPKTRWDLVLNGSVARVDSNTPPASDADADNAPPSFNWLERRVIELRAGNDEAVAAQVRQELLEARGAGATTAFSQDMMVGGRTRLEGSAYFWFWTRCILITSVLFIPVGYFYPERTYIQDEVPSH